MLDDGGRVVVGLVAGGEDDDERVAVGLARVDAELVVRLTVRVVGALDGGEAAGKERPEQLSEHVQEGRVDVWGLRGAETGDLEEGRLPGGDGRPHRRGGTVEVGQLDAAVPGGGHAVQPVPVAVEGAPQRELLPGGSPDRGQVADECRLGALVRGRPRTVGVVAGVVAPADSRSGRSGAAARRRRLPRRPVRSLRLR